MVSCAPPASFDEINNSDVKAERGELVRVSDPPLVYSAHTTGGDVTGADQASVKKTFGGWCADNRDEKLSIVSRRAKNRFLRGFNTRPQDNASNLSRARAWINMNFSALTPTLM